MTTSTQMEFLSEILEWKSVPKDTLVYFRERLRRRLHSAILDAFRQRVDERAFTQKELAQRIHKSRVVINRWLSTASNITLDSISDLMIGMGMDFDSFPFTPIEHTIAETSTRNDQSVIHEAEYEKHKDDWRKLIARLDEEMQQISSVLGTVETIQRQANAGAKGSPTFVELATYIQDKGKREAHPSQDIRFQAGAGR